MSKLQIKYLLFLFADVINNLYSKKFDDEGTSMIDENVYNIIMENADRLNSAIQHARDFEYSFFAIKTLEKAYLSKLNGRIVERPQHMLMRVAIGIHKHDIDAAIESYELMSSKYFTHASPTLFHAATAHPQLSSCFLVAVADDSIDGIYETLTRCAKITKYGGGIGVNFHNVRAKGTQIKTNNGIAKGKTHSLCILFFIYISISICIFFAKGLVPTLRLFNASVRLVDQGGNKRPGNFHHNSPNTYTMTAVSTFMYCI